MPISPDARLRTLCSRNRKLMAHLEPQSCPSKLTFDRRNVPYLLEPFLGLGTIARQILQRPHKYGDGRRGYPSRDTKRLGRQKIEPKRRKRLWLIDVHG